MIVFVEFFFIFVVDCCTVITDLINKASVNCGFS